MKICRISNIPTVHNYRPCVRQQNCITKTDEFNGSWILFAGKQNALWAEVAVYYVITVTVSDCFCNLPHVVTATQHRHSNRKYTQQAENYKNIFMAAFVN